MAPVPTLPITESGAQLLECIIVFTVLVTLVVILRIYVALALAKRRLRIDDWLIVLAWVATVINTSVTIWAIPHGLGDHIGDLDDDQLGVQFKNFTSVSYTWLVSICATKASILFFYKTIFTTNSRAFKTTLYILIGIVATFFVAYVCVFSTQCEPIYQNWNPQPGGHCRDLAIEEISSVCINIALDLSIILMPLPTLWKLQMDFKNKLTINFLLSIGLINTAIMIWRLVVTVHSENLVDFTWGLSTVLLSSDLELWVGIIAASIPTLTPAYAAWVRPLLRSAVSGVRSATGRSKGNATMPSDGSRPVLVTFGGGGGTKDTNARRHGAVGKGGAGDTLTTRDGYFELDDGYMLSGERNVHAVNVQARAGGDESSIGGSSGGDKEGGQRKSQDIEVRQEIMITDTLGRKTYDRV